MKKILENLISFSRDIKISKFWDFENSRIFELFNTAMKSLSSQGDNSIFSVVWKSRNVRNCMISNRCWQWRKFWSLWHYQKLEILHQSWCSHGIVHWNTEILSEISNSRNLKILIFWYCAKVKWDFWKIFPWNVLGWYKA